MDIKLLIIFVEKYITLLLSVEFEAKQLSEHAVVHLPALLIYIVELIIVPIWQVVGRIKLLYLCKLFKKILAYHTILINVNCDCNRDMSKRPVVFFSS